MLGALRRAGLLDEVFLTETDLAVDIAEGRSGDASRWRFRRRRFSRR